MNAFKKIQSFSLSVEDDPSLWGRACGYGVLGAIVVLLGFTALLALFLCVMLFPLVVVGVPIGYLAARFLGPTAGMKQAVH